MIKWKLRKRSGFPSAVIFKCYGDVPFMEWPETNKIPCSDSIEASKEKRCSKRWILVVTATVFIRRQTGNKRFPSSEPIELQRRSVVPKRWILAAPATVCGCRPTGSTRLPAVNKEASKEKQFITSRDLCSYSNISPVWENDCKPLIPCTDKSITRAPAGTAGALLICPDHGSGRWKRICLFSCSLAEPRFAVGFLWKGNVN